MLNQPQHGTANYDEPLNQNFATLDDKMQYKATCTHDTAAGAYVLTLLNIPAEYQDQLPAALPDAFTVVTWFPDDYAEGAKIRIGATDFTPKYASFEQGDTLTVSFYQPEQTCFFSSSRKTLPAADVTYSNDDFPAVDNAENALNEALASIGKPLAADKVTYCNPTHPLLINAKEALDELLTLASIINRVYVGVDLTVKFAAEIAAAPYNGNVWAWIQARAKAANFAGIYVGDYIPFVAGGNNIKAEIAGMDTYYNYGDIPVGHHIDFISRDCWPDARVWNKQNYNNGTPVSPYPWLASDVYAFLNSLAMQVPNAATATPALVAVDYTATGVYDKLPAQLKDVIVSKRILAPQRYTAGSLLTNDNNWGWIDVGKLWLPSEVEVYGMEHWGSKNGYSGGGFQQYPIMANNMKRVKGAGDGGGHTHWWSLSAHNGGSDHCANVSYRGVASHDSASHTSIRVPVCFRVA